MIIFDSFIIILLFDMPMMLTTAILMTVFLQIAFMRIPQKYQPFKSSHLNLIITTHSLSEQQYTYDLAEKYEEDGRLMINVPQLLFYPYAQSVFVGRLSWEVNLGICGRKIMIDTTRSTKQTLKWAFKLPLRLLFFSSQFSQSTIFSQSLSVNQILESLTLDNSMLLTTATQRQKIYLGQTDRYLAVVLFRGLQVQSRLMEGLMPFARLQPAFSSENTMSLIVQFEGVQNCFITLIVIEKALLYHQYFIVQLIPTQLCAHQDNFFKLEIYQQISISLSFDQKMDLEEKNSKNKILRFQKLEGKLLRQEVSDFNPYQPSYEVFSPHSRLLTCIPTNCSCNGFNNALNCFEDSNCNCKIDKCAPGYYRTANSDTNCASCPGSLTFCYICGLQFGGKKVICYTCITGYTILNSVCTACPYGCTTCTTASINGVEKITCDTCISNLVLQSSGSVSVCQCLSNQFLDLTTTPITCVICPAACLTCISLAICTTCVVGYYLLSPNCLACMPVCKTCTAGTTCTTCYDTTFIMVAGVCTCPAPLYYDAATLSCLSCSTIQSNCLTCSYSAPYDPNNPPTVICTAAATGYYLSSGSALACISYCDNCDLTPTPVCTTCSTALNFTFDGTSCVCDGTHFFSITQNSCLDCSEVIPGCLSCNTNPIPNPTDCSSCDPIGYYPTFAYPTTSCSACPSVCMTCNDFSTCTACYNNLIISATFQCVCVPFSNLYLDPATLMCVSCGTLIYNCQSCDGTTTPTSCLTCVSGTYPSSDSLTCYTCPVTCSTCLNATYCTACETGYDLVANACVCGSTCTDCMTNSTGLCVSCTYSAFNCLSCIVGYILSAPNTCTTCASTWTGCIECTSLACSSCTSPLIITAAGCACNSTAGLYLSINSTQCLTCSSVITGCSTCSGSTTCTACLSGYYLLNPTTCDACTGNCLTCTTSSANCLTCLITYTMVAANTCDCNFAGGYYFDPLTGGCSQCSTIIPNCLTCTLYLTNQAQCTVCMNMYYWNSSTSTCSACPVQCGLCSSLTVCTSCPNNLVLSESLSLTPAGVCVCDNVTSFLDVLTGTCESCSFIYPSCTSCTVSTTFVCSSCLPSTYLVNNTCLSCPTSCATCDQTQCLSCPGTQMLVSGACVCDSACLSCQALSVGCISCTIVANSITACSLCEAGTYLSSPNCLVCPSTCTTCTSSTNCLTCQPSYVLLSGLCTCATSLGMFPNAASTCALCSQIYDSCIECGLSSGSTVCVACASGYFVSGGQCLPCNSNCLTCSGTASTCTSCISGESLSGGVCSCSSTSCLACSAISSNCVQCLYTIYNVFSKCQVCQPGYYVDALGSCTVCPSICNTCGTNGVCLTCFSTFSIVNGTCMCSAALDLWESASTCQSCSSLISYCQTCVQNASVALNVSCASCLSGYYLLGSACAHSVCGDGQITSGQACDDGNTISKDGCNSYCQIETSFVCSGQPSLCSVNLNFKITLSAIETSKIICNRVTFTFSLYPVYDSYNSANFANMLGYINNPNLIDAGWKYGSGKVSYDFDYVATLKDASVTFAFSPAALSVNQTSAIPIITVNVKVVSTNNIPVIYYSSSVCEQKKSMKGFSDAIEYLSYVTLAASVLPCKIVGLELFGVLQMAHLNIGNMDNVNTMLTPLMELKAVHGLAVSLGKEPSKGRLLQTSSYTPSRVQSIGYEANFLRNCNVMLVIVVSIIVVSLGLYLCTYCFRKCAITLHSLSQRAIKEVLLTLILFNCFNFSYSAGIHFNYAPQDDSLCALGTTAAVLALILPIFMASGLIFMKEDGFGEFKEKFKAGTVEKMYFVVTIVYRSGIGLYISTMNEDSMSTLIVTALSIAFLMYNLVNLPYSKAYHNYRANICHLTQFICLFVAMYYRSMKSTTQQTVTATIFSPAYLEYASIFITLIVSLAVLAYEIYLFVIQCKKKQYQQKKQEEVRSFSVQKHAPTEEYIDQNINNFSLEGIPGE